MLKVKTLTKKKLEKHFTKFFNNIIDVYDPQIIIFIANGGIYLKKMIDIDQYKAKFQIVKIQRKTTSIKNIFFVKLKLKLLKKLPNFILNILRNIEHKIYIRAKLFEEKNKMIKINNFQKKRILIIDDAIDTGNTMKVLIDSIKKSNPQSTIKTAAIVLTNCNALVNPDFFIYKKILIRFPWSIDYKND